MIDTLQILDSTSMATINNMASVGIFTTLKTILLTQLNTNQFLVGGLVLGIIATIGMQLKTIPTWCFNRIKRLIVFNLYFDENDKFYIYFNRWLKENHSQKLRNAQIKLDESVSCIDESVSCIDQEVGQSINQTTDDNSITKKTYYLTTRNDYFMIWFKCFPLWIHKNQEKLEQAKDISSILYNNYNISGFFAKRMIFNLIDQVMVHADKDKEKSKTFDIYMTRFEEWYFTISTKGRTFESVIMDKNKKNNLINDITTFINNEKWYHTRGIPYTRGYLFYGCPGSGKSSLVKAMATLTKSNIHYINLSDEKLTDNNLMYNIASMKGNRPILVIEDIDTIFENRKNITQSKISFSGLLNCIDGLFSKHGTIVIFTTNRIKKLDPALIRTGRIDFKLELSYPNLNNIKEYFELFYDKKMLCNNTNINEMSMSDVQEICIRNKDNYSNGEKEIVGILTKHNGKELKTIKAKIGCGNIYK